MSVLAFIWADWQLILVGIFGGLSQVESPTRVRMAKPREKPLSDTSFTHST